MRSAALLVLAATVLGMFGSPDARAGTLADLDTPAFIRNALVSPDQNGVLVTEISDHTISHNDVDKFAQLLAYQHPNPTLQAALISRGASFLQASSTFDYWFAVVGPSVNEPVPVLASATIFANWGTATDQTRAVIDIGEGINPGGVQTGTFHYELACSSQSTSCTPGINRVRLRNEPLTVLSSTAADAHIYQVSMNAFSQSSGDGIAVSLIDLLVFQIDPRFPRHGEFSLAFSSGINNENPPPILDIPEPSVTALLLAGLATLLGVCGRRKLSSAAKATAVTMHHPRKADTRHRAG
jgi:hypothetical protein